MYYLPFSTETMVLPFGMNEVRNRLKAATLSVNKADDVEEQKINPDHTILFNGRIVDNKFTVSLKIKHPQNFLPLVKGNIEPTTFGSIVFLKYKLFFSTNLFLIFWSILSFLLTLFFLIAYHKHLYAFLCLLFGISNYLITMANFNKQVKKTHDVFHRLFE